LKPISNGSPGEGHGQGLGRLADVGGLRAHVELALGERQAQRRVLLRHERHPPHDARELLPRDVQLVLVGLGQQLTVVGELAVDQARGEHDGADLEDDLARAHPDRQVARLASRDPLELLQRPRRHVGLEAALDRRLEPRLLHAQAVGVRGHHAQLGAARRHEDAVRIGPGLVAGGGAGDLADRLHEGLRRQDHDLVAAGLGQRREVLRAQRADVEAGGPADDLDVLLGGAQLERERARRQLAGHVEHEAARAGPRSPRARPGR
jgi:hypothetical protein